MAYIKRTGKIDDFIDQWASFVHANDCYLLNYDHPIDYVYTAKVLSEVFIEQGVTFILTEYGVWPSSENEYLFQIVYRAVAGEDPSYPLKPIIFEKEETQQLRSVIQVALQSGWEGIAFDNQENWIMFGHDGQLASNIKITPAMHLSDSVKIEKVIKR